MCHCRLQAQLLSCTTFKLCFTLIWCRRQFPFLLCQITLDALCASSKVVRSVVQAEKTQFPGWVLQIISSALCSALETAFTVLGAQYAETEAPWYFSRNLTILEAGCETLLLFYCPPLFDVLNYGKACMWDCSSLLDSAGFSATSAVLFIIV